VLEQWARDTPDRSFLCERAPDGSWRRTTYGDAWSSALEIGQGLLDRGLGPDRPMAVLSGNSIEHGLLMLACYVAGVPIVPVSVAYSLQSTDFVKLRQIVNTAAPGLAYVATRQPFEAALRAIELDAVDELDSLRARPSSIDPGRITPDTVAKILFTSGSTGAPKGVINTHRMLAANQAQARVVWPFVAHEPVLLVDWLPWSHTFGGNHNFNLVLWSGGTLYIDTGRPLPGLLETTVANLREVAPTVYFNVPAGYAALLPHLEANPDFAAHFCSRLRFVMYAAAALPAEVWDRWQTLLRRSSDRPIALTTSWGTTETAPLATSAHFELDGPGCLGVPVPGVTLKLVPNGHKLEVRVKGPNVTPGYVNAADLTAAAFDQDGFYRTGDAVRFLDPEHPARGLVFDGRVSEDFKLDTGTWVSVGMLRTDLVHAGAGAIHDLVLTGHDRHEIGALVWLSPTGDADQLRVAIEKHNAAHPQSSARIARALVLRDPPSVDGGELTDKGYINQRTTLERRAADVARLYGDCAAPDLLMFE